MSAFDLLPQVLREARLERGLTQEELARKAGMGRAAVQNYEVGKCLPRLDTLSRLLSILEMTAPEFFGRMRPDERSGQQLKRHRRVRGRNRQNLAPPVGSVPLLAFNQFLQTLAKRACFEGKQS